MKTAVTPSLGGRETSKMEEGKAKVENHHREISLQWQLASSTIITQECTTILQMKTAMKTRRTKVG